MKLLVSIHDVTPAHDEKIRRLWAMCAVNGIVPALLVVPNWHGSWRLEAFPDFVDWVKQCEVAGAEIFLHGERHDEVGSPRGIRAHLRALGRTSGEGEFLTLGLEAARARIDRGLELLRGLGFHVTGFVAPAWLTTATCDRVVRESGLAVSETDTSITLHGSGAVIPSPVSRWSARTRLRAALSSLVAEARWRLHRSRDVVRIALHPGDLANAGCERSIERTLARWAAVSAKFRYADL